MTSHLQNPRKNTTHLSLRLSGGVFFPEQSAGGGKCLESDQRDLRGDLGESRM